MIRELDVRFGVYRSGALLTFLQSTEAPTISMDSSGAIKTSLQGSFLPNDKVNWLTDEVRPELIINGEVHRCGVFIPVTVERKTGENGKMLSASMYDRCFLAQSLRLEQILHLSSGTLYIDAILSLLEQCGIALVMQTPNTATLATDREDWDVGTSYLTVINQLLSEIGYKDLWFDSEGYARIEPQLNPTAENIQHRINANDPGVFLSPNHSIESDIFNKPNVFICICSNPDLGAPLTATAVNDNPQSPLSVQRRGRRISELVKVNNIASQTELQSYARQLVFDSMTSSDTITVRTGLLPGFGVEDVVALLDDDATGICVEKSWTMELTSGGKMTHTLGKVGYLYG